MLGKWVNLMIGLNNLKTNKIMKQTAVEWLDNAIKDLIPLSMYDIGSQLKYKNKIEQAKGMFEEQIIDACNQTDVIGLDHEQPGQQYYNQTYKNQREMKQTAVEWLVNHWKKLQSKGEKMSWQQIIDITELAKEMEKE